MTVLVSDPFTRTVSGGFGVEPVTGHAWTATQPGSSSTTGTVARITTGTVNQLYYGVVDCGSMDHAVRVTETLSVLPTGASITLRAVGRWADASNYVEAQLNVGTSGAVSMTINKRIGGVNTAIGSIGSVGTHAAGNAWVIILEVYGGTARARAWNASTGADPAVWQVTATFGDAALMASTATNVGFGCRREASSTNGSQVDFDDFGVETLITVQTQDAWPPRVLVSVTSILVGDSVAIYRVVGTDRTLVQNGSTVSVTDVSFLRVDAELPFGTPVSYVAVINNDETDSAPITYTLLGGKVAVSDAISGLAAEVVIWAWPEKGYNRQATVFQPGGRNVVVAGDFGQFEADVTLYTDASSSAENLRAVLAAATQGIVQIRQPGGYDGIDCHAAVTAYAERRYSQDGSDEKRLHVLHLVEVDGWAVALSAAGFTYQDLADTYAGLTYANLNADYPTYLALAQGDFS